MPAASRASAEEALPEARIVYDVAPALADRCPDETAFRKRIALRLGYDPFASPAKADAQVLRVRVTGEPHALSAEVELADRNGKVLGRRTLADPPDDCDELLASAAFAASLAIDPASTSRTVVPVEPPPAPTTSIPRPATSAPPSEARTPEPASPPPTRVTPVVRVAGGVALGTTPDVTGTVSAGVALRRKALSIGLEGRADFPSTDDVDPKVTVRASILAAAVAACAHAELAKRIEPAACFVGWVGVLHGESIGVSNPGRDVSLYGSIGPRVQMTFGITQRMGLDVLVDVPFVLTQTELRVDERVLFRTPILGVIPSAGLHWSFL